MITQLAMKNFKSWRDTGDIRFAPITAFFGSNSSGKTSLLQLLLMLKQTADSSDRSQVLDLGDDRGLVELGTFPDLLWKHDRSACLEWRVQWELPQPLKVEDPAERKRVLFEGNRLGFSACVEWRGNSEGDLGRMGVSWMAYKFADSVFGMKSVRQSETEYDLLQNHQDFKFVRSPGRAWPLPAPAKCYGFPDQVRAYYQNAGFLSDLELEFERLFSGLFYLGPLRDYPKRQYQWAGSHPADMGRRGERVVDALLSARETGKLISRGRGQKRQTLEERVAWWLKKLDLIDHFEVRPITSGGRLFQVWVRRYPSGPEVLITDVGFGVSQILPVITLCYHVPKGSTIILEQPEIHLHPSVQAGLADVLVDTATTRNVQILVESHSEHLLRRLQRRMAEEKLRPDDAALYFCSMGPDGSRLTSLDLDPFGQIVNWPQDFFGDEFGEMAAMGRAIQRRKKEATG